MTKIFFKSYEGDSQFYLGLTEVCENNSIDIDLVNQLLYSINAQPELTSFIRILENLRRIIRAAIHDNWNFENKPEIAPWFLQVDQLLQCSEELKIACGDQLIKKQKSGEVLATHPLYGQLLLYPFYSALWNRADIVGLEMYQSVLLHDDDRKENSETKENFIKDFQFLQLCFLKIHMSLFESYVPIDAFMKNGDFSLSKGFKDSLNQACTSLRKFSHPENFQALRRLVSGRSSHAFFSRLAQSEFQDLDDIASPIRRLILKWIDSNPDLASSKSVHGRRRAGIKKGAYSFYVEQTENVAISAEDIETSSTALSIKIMSSWSLSNEWEDADLPAEESNDDTIEVLLVQPKCRRRGSYEEQIMASVGLANKRKTINNHVPIQEGLMTYAEISKSIGLLDLIVGKTKDSNQRLCSALAIVGFWLSTDIEKTRLLSVVQNAETLSDKVELAFVVETREWRIWVPIFKPKKKPTLEQKALCRLCGEHMYLPDLLNLYRYLEPLLDETQGTDVGNIESDISKPFNRLTAGNYKKMLGEIFRPLKEEGLRITPSKLFGELNKRFLVQGDPMMAMVLTGRPHEASGVIRHYATPKIPQITEFYKKCIAKVLDKSGLRSKFGFYLNKQATTSNRSLQCVGAELCPRTNSIRNLFSKLRVIHESPNKVTFQAYHNYFTIYTALTIGYCTGYRAIRNIDIGASRRDKNRNVGWISDKDDAEGYHSRMIWIPPQLEQQLRSYEAHVKIVFASWELHFPGVTRPPGLDYLFILDTRKKSPVPICPSTMAGPLAKFEYPLPLNSNRRWLRTKLSERGCPIDVINVFMGHWKLGEEPSNPFSSHSPRYYFRQIEKYLSPLIVEIGFEPIESRWVK